MREYQVDLEALQRAAHARDADQTQFLLKKLFLRMEFVMALAIAAEQVHGYLDTFERYHPAEVWPRRMLSQIVMTGVPPNRQIIEQAFEQFDTPGTANFIKALYDLFNATQDTFQSEARVGYLVSAVVNALTAQLVELYFGERPDAWQAYRETGDPQAALAFWTDDTVATRDVALWLAVAENVQAKIERG